MFQIVKRFLGGEFAVTDEARRTERLLDAVIALPLKDVCDEAFRLLPVSDEFNVFESSPLPDGVRLPPAATEFLTAFGHVVRINDDLEINAAHIKPWPFKPGVVVLGYSPSQFINLLLDLNTDHVYEQEDSEMDLLPGDALPTVFHWIVYEERLSVLRK